MAELTYIILKGQGQIPFVLSELKTALIYSPKVKPSMSFFFRQGQHAREQKSSTNSTKENVEVMRVVRDPQHTSGALGFLWSEAEGQKHTNRGDVFIPELEEVPLFYANNTRTLSLVQERQWQKHRHHVNNNIAKSHTIEKILLVAPNRRTERRNSCPLHLKTPWAARQTTQARGRTLTPLLAISCLFAFPESTKFYLKVKLRKNNRIVYSSRLHS